MGRRPPSFDDEDEPRTEAIHFDRSVLAEPEVVEERTMIIQPAITQPVASRGAPLAPSVRRALESSGGSAPYALDEKLLDGDTQLWVGRGPSGAVLVELGEAADRGRLERLAAACKKMNHAHVVRVLDHGVIGGKPFIAHEMVEGVLLAAVLAKGPVPLLHAVDIAARAAEVIDHARGVDPELHCRLTPERIILTAGGEVRVARFELSERPGLSDLANTLCAMLGDMSNVDPKLRGVLIELANPNAEVREVVLALRRFHGDLTPVETLEAYSARVAAGATAGSAGGAFRYLAESAPPVVSKARSVPPRRPSRAPSAPRRDSARPPIVAPSVAPSAAPRPRTAPRPPPVILAPSRRAEPDEPPTTEQPIPSSSDRRRPISSGWQRRVAEAARDPSIVDAEPVDEAPLRRSATPEVLPPRRSEQPPEPPRRSWSPEPARPPASLVKVETPGRDAWSGGQARGGRSLWQVRPSAPPAPPPEVLGPGEEPYEDAPEPVDEAPPERPAPASGDRRRDAFADEVQGVLKDLWEE